MKTVNRSDLKDYFEYFLFRSVCVWLRTKPVAKALATHRWLGRFWYERLKIRRSVALENLRYAFPEKSAAEIDQLARRVFLHFSRVGIETVLMPKFIRMDLDRQIGMVNWQVLEQAFAEGKGVILVGGHIGNWEIVASAVPLQGFPIWAVAENQRNSLVEPLLNEHRIKAGLKIINRTQSKFFLPRIFKKGEMILLLSDQDAGRHGVFVPFFGRLTSTPAGAAVCALRYGAPLVYFNSIYRQGKYDIYFERLFVPVDLNYSAQNIRLVTAQHVARLEQDIRCFPEQWFWVHRRWKTPREKAERRG